MRELHLPTASRHAVTARHPRYLQYFVISISRYP
jgi:hypothetical protein